MPKQGKSPKKKTKEKSPQRTGESEYPEMEQDDFNRLLQNAIEQYRRIYDYITLAYQHAISAGMCPELIFPYIPYLLLIQVDQARR